MKQQTVVGYTDITDADVPHHRRSDETSDLIRVSLGEPDTTYLRILAGEFMSAEQHHRLSNNSASPATEIEQAVAEEAKRPERYHPGFPEQFPAGAGSIATR